MSRTRIWGFVALSAVAAGAVLAGIANAREQAGIYTVHALVSDSAAVTAPAVDGSLVNGWGLSVGPTTPWWTANNGTNTSTLYNGAGTKSALTVAVPGGRPAPCSTATRPTSWSARTARAAQPGSCSRPKAAPSWAGRPASTRPPQSSAPTAPVSGAIYKGLAVANDKLYATDFHNGRVDVFDKSFNLVPGGFTDPKVPKGFAPFGIQALGGQHLRHLREAGCRQEGRRRGARARATSMSSRPTARWSRRS